ncbi:MAG TPA: hypothetical protein VLI90_10790 [Tepidisphaeraceae bacterium]|nr:hypothetical protein [Tepidisphaeraceae bacterium]
MSRMNDPSSQGNMGGGSAGGGGGAGATDQLRDKASEVGQNLRDMGSQARDAATEKYNQLRDQASQYYTQGREAAQEWEQNLESYIHEQPMKAVLMAAGVGLLLGLLWKRS